MTHPFGDQNPYESPVVAELLDRARAPSTGYRQPWYYAPWWLWMMAAPFLGIIALVVLLAILVSLG